MSAWVYIVHCDLSEAGEGGPLSPPHICPSHIRTFQIRNSKLKLGIMYHYYFQSRLNVNKDLCVISWLKYIQDVLHNKIINFPKLTSRPESNEVSRVSADGGWDWYWERPLHCGKFIATRQTSITEAEVSTFFGHFGPFCPVWERSWRLSTFVSPIYT